MPSEAEATKKRSVSKARAVAAAKAAAAKEDQKAAGEGSRAK